MVQEEEAVGREDHVSLEDLHDTAVVRDLEGEHAAEEDVRIEVEQVKQQSDGDVEGQGDQVAHTLIEASSHRDRPPCLL